MQRRLAARRERERRRPTAERRYTFSSAEQAELSEEEVDGTPEPVRAAAPVARTTAQRGPTNRPFISYKAEYAYVTQDLRRIAVVIGSLLIVLIILSFVLPR